MSGEATVNHENGGTELPEPFKMKFSLDSDPGVVNLDDVDVVYAGMPKDVLLKFSQTPFWNRFRRATYWAFWLIWLGLIAAVIALSITYKGCETKPALQWWKEDVIYQVYPRSFKDSDGDGNGDLKGLESKLPYLKDLGVGAIWLNSVYRSAPGNLGDDVTDHMDILDPVFGSLADFDSFLKAVHDLGMKLIMDFLPNHTSDKHKWFVESQKSGSTNPYRNYYLWQGCGASGISLPNNWLDVQGDPAWEYDATRSQCYYHAFYKSQPDLNLRNNRVRQELDEVLRFWLNKGVDGFNIRDPEVLFEDYDLRDNPINGHNFTRNQPELYELITRWRGVLEEFSSDGSPKRVLVTMPKYVTEDSELDKYYGPIDGSGVDLVLFSDLLDGLKTSCDGKCVRDAMERVLKRREWPTWSVGGPDVSRVASRLGHGYVNAVNMLMLMSPGTAVTYYGEEIGMGDNSNLTASTDPRRDSDPYRTPMQWNDTANAGFTDGQQTWLPTSVSETVGAQEGDPSSHLGVYRQLVALHRDGGLTHRDITFIDRDDNVLSFFRTWDGQNRFLVAINFGNDTVSVDFTNPENFLVPKDRAASATVVVATHKKLASSTIDAVELGPLEGVVFQWSYVLPYFE